MLNYLIFGQALESIIDSPKLSLFGLLKGKAEIKGDILESIEEKWDVCI